MRFREVERRDDMQQLERGHDRKTYRLEARQQLTGAPAHVPEQEGDQRAQQENTGVENRVQRREKVIGRQHHGRHRTQQ